MAKQDAAHKAARLAVIFEKAMRQQGTNPYRLAKKTGLGLLTVQRMTSGESPRPGAWAVLAIARALHLDPTTLFAEVEHCERS